MQSLRLIGGSPELSLVQTRHRKLPPEYFLQIHHYQFDLVHGNLFLNLLNKYWQIWIFSFFIFRLRV